MGISTDAQLVFGFIIKENPKYNFVYKSEGEFEYTGNYRKNIVSSFDDWLEFTEQDEETCPAEIVRFGSLDDEQYILALRGTLQIAYEGNTKIISLQTVNISPEKIANFKEWCEKYKIRKKEPKWILCGYTG